MKAAVCYAFGQPLVVEEVDLGPPRTGEVQVRLKATGICHSDVHLIRGEWGGKLPVVAGHEGAGVVEAVGPGVTLAKPGDRVVVSLLRSCGRCAFCQTGAPYMCAGSFPLDAEGLLRNRRGEPLGRGFRTATFAERAVVDQSQVALVPDDMPLDQAALLACGVITGLGAVVNTARVPPGSSVVVIGTGGVGLNAIQGAVISGAGQIIGVDRLDAKLEAARAFGATDTVNGAQRDAAEAVAELTEGAGAEYVFVTVGSAAAVALGLRMIGTLGTLVIVGLPEQGATVPLTIDQIVNSGQRVVGSNMGSTRLSVDVPRLVALHRQKRLKLAELISARYPLERINEAIEAMERGEALRNVIVFD
jgi:S-(hydroxymethyl)glutathione dehydrogenase / alcohol dehydrogenase